MWKDPQKKLTDHLYTNNTVKIESLVIAEWNMNDFQELINYGSYRYRPSNESSIYYRLPNTYDPLDFGDYYTGVERSFFTYADFLRDNDEPVLFQSEDVNRKLYFDLRQCFDPFRPRSGINKLLYFGDTFINASDNQYIDNVRSAKRPRYYMSTRYDTFKYWNSYRFQVENDSPKEIGISYQVNPNSYNSSIGYIIEDTAPFVVYKKPVPTNRIVVKMQTNLAKDSIGDISTRSGQTISDPLANRESSSIPKRWSIEYLDINDNWITAIKFDENSLRLDESEIVDWDGYVELFYGVKVPDRYKPTFHFVDYALSDANLPMTGLNDGEAYIVGLTETFGGELYIWDSIENSWYVDDATYGFSLYEYDDTKKIGVTSSLTDPTYFKLNGQDVFTELVFIKGLRLGIESMIAPDKTFDLIELSPRLRCNITQYVSSFQITKSIGSDSSQLPVGGLIASTGTIELINLDDAFVDLNYYNTQTGLSSTNKGSIVAQYLKPNIKFDIYEIVLDVNGYDKYIPLQTFYGDSVPNAMGGMKTISVNLRDQFFRFESMRAPDIMLTQTTLTSAIAILMDHCGFSNYVFKGFDDLAEIKLDAPSTSIFSSDYPTYYPPEKVDLEIGDGRTAPTTLTINYINNLGQKLSLEDAWTLYWKLSVEYNFKPISHLITGLEKLEYYSDIDDPVIPFFFTKSDISVAQILAMLSNSTQTAMFFDEYNNFVVMPKEYVMPSNTNKRPTDLVLYGQTVGNKLSNIASIESSEDQIFNDGTIKYSIKYIQKEVAKLSENFYTDEDKILAYKPVLLWEVGSNEETRAKNDDKTATSGYALTAVPLNSTITSDPPYVVNNQIINNIFDVGESVSWIGRFQGYFYANGEIIRYDAIEYDISGVGKVWLTSNREYQNYFQKLSFKGKMFRTGRVRIFVEPFYEDISKISTDANIQIYDSGLTKGEKQYRLNSPTVRFKNGEVQRHGRGQFGTEITTHEVGLPNYWSDNANVRACVMDQVNTYLFTTKPESKITYPAAGATTVAVGVNNTLAQASTRNGIIKNFMRKSYPTNDVVKKLKSTQSGTIQSSALVFVGPPSASASVPKISYVSYVYKSLDSAYRHAGTRMRIIGKYEANENIVQSPNNGSSPVTYYNVQPDEASQKVNIDGGSGGIAIGINPTTNQGYYFEICALTGSNVQQYNKVNDETGQPETVLHNVVFYKVYNSGGKAVPRKLWGGLASIIVDEGLYVGQDRIGIQEKPTVYDLAVEYVTIGSVKRFYLYLNNKQIATVDDTTPLPDYPGIALFTRGQSECMFEYVYALKTLNATNSEDTLIQELNINNVFDKDSVTTSEAMRKYSLSGFVKSSYLSGISGSSASKYNIYLDEFGTILRECAYFNVKYDQAYPALIAVIAPTITNDRGYSISGFRANAYGAEFLVFNCTDKAITLDDTTGNYLRIVGVTFTQQTSAELSVDQFFNRRSNFSNPVLTDVNNIYISPMASEKIYEDIVSSRKKYGRKEFLIESEYIQSEDDANKLMEWIMTKALRKRIKIQAEVFGVPHIQLGDLISINYIKDNLFFIDPNKQFVVQSINHSMRSGDRKTQLLLAEI